MKNGRIQNFGTVVHEYTHANQYEEMGLLKYLFMKVFFRKKIEKEAEEQEAKACQWAYDKLIKGEK